MIDTPMHVRVRARRPMRREREVTTPEGVLVRLPIASLGARALAFFIDMLAISGLVVVAFLFFGILAGLGIGQGLFMGLAILTTFLVRNFYFMVFELLWAGRTPGKRLFSLRVVDRNGRLLSAEAAFVRNVTRDVEFFLPLVVILDPQQLWPNAEGWGLLLSSVWLLIGATLPLFNRERLRLGDLLGGTVVVRTGQTTPLYDDLAMGPFMRVNNQRPVYGFSPEQLDMYGIFELQVLEDVLRTPPRTPHDPLVLSRVAAAVRRKIGWDGETQGSETRGAAGGDWQFLFDFYAALRARHERRVMLGQRQEHKQEGTLGGVRVRPSLVVHRMSGQFSAAGTPAPTGPGGPPATGPGGPPATGSSAMPPRSGD